MNLFRLSLSYIQKRKLNTLLNVLLLAMGIATIVVLILFSKQVEDNLTKNAQGVDLVVGATGSPLQLILSAIYHMDSPTGNIPLSDAQTIMRHPQVKQVIPLALGDSYRGRRIVGTDTAYVNKYGGTLADGRIWDHTMEAVLGADVAVQFGIGVGSELISSHGLSEGGTDHGDRPLEVVGVLQPTGTVIDGLVLTSVQTVWAVHEEHEDDEEHEEGEEHDDDHDHDEGEHDEEGHDEDDDAPEDIALMDPTGRDLTALLVSYRTPLAAALFPRFVNSQPTLQAAAPAFETARLLNLLGIGVDALRAFGVILIIAAALGVFIALYNALQERKYDLAIMRSLGASRMKLMTHVLLEGLIMVSLGLLVGLALGHLATEILSTSVAQAQQMKLTGWTWAEQENWLFLIAFSVGIVSAMIPAIQAYLTDIAQTLARG